MKFNKSIFFRFLIISILAASAFGLRLMVDEPPQTSEQIEQNFSRKIVEIDREVDSILVRFRIEKNWCRKKLIPITGTNLDRIEKRVLIPPEIMPILINRELNLMAQRYGGRAIGSENSKENSVTIHIKLEGYILETIILKTSKDLQREATKVSRKKKAL